MADIAFDAVSTRQADTASSLTFAHTCTGDNRILFVGFNMDTDVATGVTYNGVAMTQVGKTVATSGRYTYLYYLIAPATGANDVVISSSGSTTIIGYSISYTGALQDVLDDSATNTATATTSITTSVTTTADNCWTVAFIRINGGNDITGGAGTTLRGSATTNAEQIADSNGPITPPGSTSLIFNYSSTNAAVVMASFAPAEDAVGGGNPMFLSSGGMAVA